MTFSHPFEVFASAGAWVLPIWMHGALRAYPGFLIQINTACRWAGRLITG